jgi:DNA-binding PadR family transcriptional regulator
MQKRSWSELECFVLGLVWQMGPVSPYDIRTHMLKSPSTKWSGSAGAIYPLIRKLTRHGLVAGRQEQVGQRRRVRYKVTAAGLRALKAWIGPPLATDAITVSYDPLRSRARFLAALTPAQRRRWVQAARAALVAVEERVRRWHELYAADGDVFLALLTRHGELDVAARRKWLSSVPGMRATRGRRRIANRAHRQQ